MYKKFISLALALTVSTAVVGCSSRASIDKNRYTATVEAKSFYIMSEINGKVTEVSLKQGETVKEGQSVIKLDTALYEIQKRQALAVLSQARAQQSGLNENPKESKKNQSQGSIDAAQASIDMAQLQIDKCNIVAQGEGIVEDVYVNKGEMVSAGINIAKIMDMSNKYIKVFVEEAKRNSVKLGDSIPLYVNDELIGNGIIEYIASESEFTPKNTETNILPSGTWKLI